MYHILNAMYVVWSTNQSLAQDHGSFKLEPLELFWTLLKGSNQPSAIPNN